MPPPRIRSIQGALADVHRTPPTFSFGIPRLDLRVGHVGPGDLVVVATSGSVATGPFLSFVALEAARRGVMTLYVADTIAERTAALFWLAAATGIDAAELRDRALPTGLPSVTAAIADLSGKPLHYAESASATIEDVVGLFTSLPAPPGLVVVELASSVLGTAHTIGPSVHALRRAAVTHDCVVIASAAAADDHREDADRLPFLGLDATTREIATVFLELESDEGPDNERRVQVRFTRTRGGEIGFAPLIHHRATGRFEDWRASAPSSSRRSGHRKP